MLYHENNRLLLVKPTYIVPILLLIYFGHQFAKRIGQGMNNPGNEDKSQIFLQYLDCITQLMYQFPS